MLYDFIDWKYVDEFLALGLFLLFMIQLLYSKKKLYFQKTFLYCIIIFFFYLIYSFFLKKNIPQAILTDFVLQFKPYIAFFCTYALMPNFTEKNKYYLKQTALLLSVFSFVLVLFGATYQFYGHPSRFATGITILALLYLYCSGYTLKDKIIFLLILSIGLFSGRSKFFGFYAASVFFIFIKPDTFLRISLKNIIITAVIFTSVVYLARHKIEFYFIEGLTAEGEIWARPVLYMTGFQIMIDYFPFGTGFGTFGSYASGLYYSNVYVDYEIDMIWGLTKDWPEFVNDTYYPVIMGQFGFIGLMLFFMFWGYIFRKAKRFYKSTRYEKFMAFIFMILSFFMIESIADATMTHNRGLFMMMFLACILSIEYQKVLNDGEEDKEIETTKIINYE